MYDDEEINLSIAVDYDSLFVYWIQGFTFSLYQKKCEHYVFKNIFIQIRMKIENRKKDKYV